MHTGQADILPAQGGKMGGVFGPHVRHQGEVWVGPYPLGVGHDEPNGDGQHGEQDEQAQHNALPQRDAGKARSDSGSEWIDGGADDSCTRPQ